MRLHTFFLLAVVSATSGAQAPTPAPSVLKQSDMWAAFAKYESGLSNIVGAPKATTEHGADAVATRAMVIAEMDRVFDECKPKFRLTPRPLKVYQDSIDKHNPDPKVRAILTKLVQWGCVATVGPLVTGPGEGMDNKQFGDALGFFMLRIIQLTHQPDPKWSPDLQSIGGD